MCLASEQVDHADEFTFCSDRKHHDEWVRAEHGFNLLDDAVEICTDAVKFVDVNDPSDLGVICVAPVSFRLRLDAAGAAEHTHTAV